MKRGQAAGAAVLVAIIAAILVGFIILIPPEERAKILDDDFENDSDTIEEKSSEKNLLTFNPGRVDYLAQKEIEHPLPVVNVFTLTQGKVVAEKNLAHAKRAVFTDESTQFPFSISQLEHTENVLLSFTVKSLVGRLVISLNGELVFDGSAAGIPGTIKLPKNSLKADNILTFESSSPGAAFWVTNEVFLENIKVVGDVTSVDAQSSKNVFLVSDTEKSNLEKMVLQFQPTCNYGDVGRLKISVNRNEIYNAVPDCDIAMVPIEFSSGLVNRGENEIIFFTEKGRYLLSHVLLESQLKEVEFPTYYFELSHEEYEDAQDERRRVRMELEFVDVTTRKFGEIIFNGHTHHFDTKEVSYTIDLSDDVVQGNNALKIKPRKTVEIRELTVDFVR
jgi:ligand-binding SRPBCC domain-containing protein